MVWIVRFVALFLLTGCAVSAVPPPTSPSTAAKQAALAGPPPDFETAAENFVTVMRRVVPVAEEKCREATRGVNCNYSVVVDDDASKPPNAFQTLDENGRPIIGFTLSLIADARNRDEIAFILSHEAAHHIAGHIARGQQTAQAGAVLAGALAQLGGGDEGMIRSAQQIGGQIGARSFAKSFELEADALGAQIARDAGYDPVRGADYFLRVPDPGNVFLGTHPPNAERLATVRRALGQ